MAARRGSVLVCTAAVFLHWVKIAWQCQNLNRYVERGTICICNIRNGTTLGQLIFWTPIAPEIRTSPPHLVVDGGASEYEDHPKKLEHVVRYWVEGRSNDEGRKGRPASMCVSV